ncbi:MAG: hypothetical protein ACLS35_05965, partial [Odoribacter splanchnicus]
KGDNPAWPKGSKSRGFSSGLALPQKNANNQLDKEDSCRNKEDIINSSLPLHQHCCETPKLHWGTMRPGLWSGLFHVHE